jgi:hypothetical protein
LPFEIVSELGNPVLRALWTGMHATARGRLEGNLTWSVVAGPADLYAASPANPVGGERAGKLSARSLPESAAAGIGAMNTTSKRAFSRPELAAGSLGPLEAGTLSGAICASCLGPTLVQRSLLRHRRLVGGGF